MPRLKNHASFLLLLLAASTPAAGDLEDVAALHKAAVEAQKAGDFVAAEKLHRKTLEAMVEIPDYPPNERARQMSNLASTLNLTGRPAEALELLLPATKILQEHPSTDPGQYIALDLNLARALSLLERYEEAESHCLEAIARAEDMGGMSTMYGAEVRSAHAYIQWKTGRVAEAVANYESAIRYWSDFLAQDHPLLENLRSELEGATADQKDDQQAASPATTPASAITAGPEGIRFDPSRCTPQDYRYDYDFGSTSVRVRGITEGSCLFEYLFEMEGGYTVYACRVPDSSEEVSVRWTWQANPDGRGGHNFMKTSFDLERCEVVRTGNVFLDEDQGPWIEE